LRDEVGATGNFTNHSLRQTCATRLFQNGVDEQQIMSIIGHLSRDAVRVYKEMSHDQEKQLSNPNQKLQTINKSNPGQKDKNLRVSNRSK
jgi:site-specific recombinase XerD